MSTQTPYSSSAIRPLAIDWLEVSNYRSLGDDARITFGGLTALVGPNGAGKSNVLDVLRFLREALTLGLEPAIAKRLGIARLRRDAPSKPRSVKIGVSVLGRYEYRFQLDAAKHGGYKVAAEQLKVASGVRAAETILSVRGDTVQTAPEGLAPVATGMDLVLTSIASHPQVKPLLDVLRGVRIHSIFPRELSAPQAIGTRPPLDDTGSNWCAALKGLSPSSKEQLELALTRITGDIESVRVDTSGGLYVAEFLHRVQGATRWFNAAQESDGTLRLAGILTALLQDPPPQFIAIEEPELTINPGLLPLVYDHILGAADRTQVTFTTHSPELLDLVDIADVRVVQRLEGATQVNPVSPTQKGIVRDALASPGELLRSGGFAMEGQETTLLDLVRSE